MKQAPALFHIPWDYDAINGAFLQVFGTTHVSKTRKTLCGKQVATLFVTCDTPTCQECQVEAIREAIHGAVAILGRLDMGQMCDLVLDRFSWIANSSDARSLVRLAGFGGKEPPRVHGGEPPSILTDKVGDSEE